MNRRMRLLHIHCSPQWLRERFGADITLPHQGLTDAVENHYADLYGVIVVARLGPDYSTEGLCCEIEYEKEDGTFEVERDDGSCVSDTHACWQELPEIIEEGDTI